MSTEAIFDKIRGALSRAPRNRFTSEMHLQMLKYADELNHVTGKEFCELAGLSPSFGTEFSKMRNLTERLVRAGLRVDDI